MWVNKQQLEIDTEQWSGSKLRKVYVKAIYCHLALYAEYIIRNARLDEAQAGIKIAGEITTTDVQPILPYWQKAKRN